MLYIFSLENAGKKDIKDAKMMVSYIEVGGLKSSPPMD